MANEFKDSFREMLKAHRRAMGPGNRAKSRKSKTKIKFPYPVAKERRYYNMIAQVMGVFRKEVSQVININLENWIKEKHINDNQGIDCNNLKEFTFNLTGDETPIKTDTWIDDINFFIADLKSRVSTGIFGEPGEPPEDSSIWQDILTIATAVYAFTQNQWKTFTKSAVGFEFITDELWWADVQKAWISENYMLLTNLSEDYINKVNETVFRGIRQGIRVEEIKKEIRDINGKMFGPRKDGKQSRAELIARDQMGKLNGQITKNRMQESGLDLYEWLTAVDERVRGRPGGKFPNAIPSHWEMEGKICTWENSSIYAEKGNVDKNGNLIWMSRTSTMPIAIPGEEVQCRCTAAAYMEMLFEEIDREIEQEAA